MKSLSRLGWFAALMWACFCNGMAQDTTSFRMAAFTDSGEMVLFNDDSTTMYVGMLNTNGSYNALFHDPASGDLYCLHDTLNGSGDRRFFRFDPFSQTATFAYAPLPLFLAAACPGPNGKVYTVTGNSVLPGEIFEIDLVQQTYSFFTSTDFTFGGGAQTGLNITYYPPTNELWLFGGGVDSLIKINVSTLVESRVSCALFGDGAIKGTYLDGDFFWLASDLSYNLDVNAGLFATASSFPVYGYITDFELLDLIEGGDTMAICSGDSTPLTCRFDADGFAWYLNGAVIAPGSQTIMVGQPGTYRLLAHSDNGYDMWSEEVVVVTGTSPVADFSQSDDTIYNLGTVNFTDLSSGGSSILWDFGDGNSSTLPSPSHMYNVAAGTYPVMQIVANGHCTDTAFSDVEVLALVSAQPGQPGNPIQNLVCHPNPTASIAHISFYLGASMPVRIEVLNPMGQLAATLHDGELDAGAQEIAWCTEKAMDQAVASGLYFLRIVTPEGSLTRRIGVLH